MTIILLLGVAAFICAVLFAAGKCPVWVATVLLSLALMLQALPLG